MAKKRYRLYVTRLDSFGGMYEEAEETSSNYLKLSEKAKEIAKSRKVISYQIVEID